MWSIRQSDHNVLNQTNIIYNWHPTGTFLVITNNFGTTCTNKLKIYEIKCLWRYIFHETKKLKPGKVNYLKTTSYTSQGKTAGLKLSLNCIHALILMQNLPVSKSECKDLKYFILTIKFFLQKWQDILNHLYINGLF